MIIKNLATGLAFAVVVCWSASGCGNPGPDTKVEQARLGTALQFAGYYNKVNGDYDQLDPADKAAFVKLSGGESNAKKFWQGMKDARTHPLSQGGAHAPGASKPGT